MKSKTLNTSNLSWYSPIPFLFGNKKAPSYLENLSKAGIVNLKDVLWIIPLRLFKTPSISSFENLEIDGYFRGEGKIIHLEIKPAFGRKNKGKFLLYNGYCVVQDKYSAETLILRWFNIYPNQKKQLEQLEEISFLGLVQLFKNQRQIIAPRILNTESHLGDYLIEYPTINKVSGTFIKKLIDHIPDFLWEKISPDLAPMQDNHLFSLQEAFKIIHGKIPPQNYNIKLKAQAEERLIYEEFFWNQLKILTRKKYLKTKAAPLFFLEDEKLIKIIRSLPFELTPDQNKVINEIKNDFKSGQPMMRMIQGDVGCGKTIVAYISSVLTIENNYQVALMCPTETLASQHLETFRSLNPNFKIEILLGSTKTKVKENILERLKNGDIHILIGTHSLIQENVIFSKLGLAVIDEQHKFGVEQRLKLISKGMGVHSIIMSATPIPRTLSLAQYGDLDISIIKSMPKGRIAIKTRIVENVNYEKYLQFIKSRLLLGEQAYFVFPAIEESEKLTLKNVKDGFDKYKEIFKEFSVGMLHGQMKSEEKEKIIKDFQNNKIQILISTSVIEVGVNIPNSTIMSIYNPERFGLSSLHQLRGRIGRGQKPGFCFLIAENELSKEAFDRLRVIENNLDGFIIAEEDLKFRGEGDLFGVNQSGTVSTNKIASFISHAHILEKVIKDIQKILIENSNLLSSQLESLAKDQKILDTI